MAETKCDCIDITPQPSAPLRAYRISDGKLVWWREPESTRADAVSLIDGELYMAMRPEFSNSRIFMRFGQDGTNNRRGKPTSGSIGLGKIFGARKNLSTNQFPIISGQILQTSLCRLFNATTGIQEAAFSVVYPSRDQIFTYGDKVDLMGEVVLGAGLINRWMRYTTAGTGTVMAAVNIDGRMFPSGEYYYLIGTFDNITQYRKYSKLDGAESLVDRKFLNGYSLVACSGDGSQYVGCLLNHSGALELRMYDPGGLAWTATLPYAYAGTESSQICVSESGEIYVYYSNFGRARIIAYRGGGVSWNVASSTFQMTFDTRVNTQPLRVQGTTIIAWDRRLDYNTGETLWELPGGFGNDLAIGRNYVFSATSGSLAS